MEPIRNFIDFLNNYVGFIDMLDIIVVAFVFYYIFLIIKGTRAMQMLLGVALIVTFYFISGKLGMKTTNQLLFYILYIIPFAVVILFQSTIRKVLANLGRNPFRIFLSGFTYTELINELILALLTMSSEKTGALIVIEKEQGLKTYSDTGITLDAVVSYDLLTNIFSSDTPLHDGAVIIVENRIASAGCFLPLSNNPALSQKYGTRHRAAIGITEETDAIALIVSEERGVISMAVDGVIHENMKVKELRTGLHKHLGQGKEEVILK